MHPFPFGRPARRATPLARLGAAALACCLAVTLLVPRAAAQDDDEEALAGQFTVTISREEVPPTLANGPALQGQWVIAFDDGAYTLSRQDIGLLVTGSYETDGETVTITDEGGLYACAPPVGSPPDADVRTARYSWERRGDELTLVVIEDGCEPRRLILSTRSLAVFVSCVTAPLDLSEESDPDDGANGEEDEKQSGGLGALEEAAQEDDQAGGATPAADADAGTPVAGDEDEAAEESEATEAAAQPEDPEEAIDALLGQLTACWATRDPAVVLPLFSAEFVEGLVDGGGPGATLLDVAAQLEQLMVVPVTWERAGSLELDEDGEEAEAVVSAQIGPEELFQTFRFVLEEDGWKLDNLGE